MEKNFTRVVETSTGKVFALGQKQDFIELSRGVYAFPKQLINQDDFQFKTRFGFNGEYGLVKWHDFLMPGTSNLLKNLFFQFMLPKKNDAQSLFRLMCFKRTGSNFLIEDFSDDEGAEPLDLKEFRIEEKKRVKNLVKYYLQFIEESESALSKLYKDPKDGRLWQLININNNTQLHLVNQSQWSYEYLERKYYKERFKDISDKEFFESLVDHQIKLECAENGCSDNKVQFSSLCPKHHFEAVKGHLYVPKK